MLKTQFNLINEELKDIEWDNILEVGCSHGDVLIEVKREFPDKDIQGIDNEESYADLNYKGMIEEGRERGLDISRGDGKDMKFTDNSFDIVYCQAVMVMNTIKDFKKIISEMIRVAKKRVVIIEPHSEEYSKEGEYYGDFHEGNHRLIANYRFLEDMGYKVTIKRMPDLWGGKRPIPWGVWGHIITIHLCTN